MAALAAAAAAELHKANPKLYPSAPHAWSKLTADQLHAPMLCVVCHERILPEEDIKVRHSIGLLSWEAASLHFA